jgi:hypothetical protein
MTDPYKEAIARMEHRLDELMQAMGEVRERLARMEGAALHNVVEGLRVELAAAHARIGVLEAAHNRSEGMMTSSKTWGEWTHRLAPWLVAVALVVWNYLKPPQ